MTFENTYMFPVVVCGYFNACVINSIFRYFVCVCLGVALKCMAGVHTADEM